VWAGPWFDLSRNVLHVIVFEFSIKKVLLLIRLEITPRVFWVVTARFQTWFLPTCTFPVLLGTWARAERTIRWPSSLGSVSVIGVGPVHSSVSGGRGWQLRHKFSWHRRVMYLPDGGGMAQLWSCRSSPSGGGGSLQIRSLYYELLLYIYINIYIYINHAMAVGWHIQGRVQGSRFSVCNCTSRTPLSRLWCVSSGMVSRSNGFWLNLCVPQYWLSTWVATTCMLSCMQNTTINLLRALLSAATWLMKLFYEVYNYSMPIYTQSSYTPCTVLAGEIACIFMLHMLL